MYSVHINVWPWRMATCYLFWGEISGKYFCRTSHFASIPMVFAVAELSLYSRTGVSGTLDWKTTIPNIVVYGMAWWRIVGMFVWWPFTAVSNELQNTWKKSWTEKCLKYPTWLLGNVMPWNIIRHVVWSNAIYEALQVRSFPCGVSLTLVPIYHRTIGPHCIPFDLWIGPSCPLVVKLPAANSRGKLHGSVFFQLFAS